MMETFKTTIESPVGFLEIVTDRHFLLSISFTGNYIEHSGFQPDILKETIKQITEYFSGSRKEFNLDMKPSGTGFQLKVWEQLKKIPFGNTVTYLEIAKQTGNVNNTRAVGLANGKNPIPIIIPCHRVIGSNGKLTGYAGGVERKKWLLNHERLFSQNQGILF